MLLCVDRSIARSPTRASGHFDRPKDVGLHACAGVESSAPLSERVSRQFRPPPMPCQCHANESRSTMRVAVRRVAGAPMHEARAPLYAAKLRHSGTRAAYLLHVRIRRTRG